MKFDIKDVKSWANRNTVKIGDKGYFFDDIHSMKDKKDCTAFTISGILDNRADCFCIKNRIGISSFNFFLPVEEVEEDKPKEKGYRPFRTIAEVDELLAKDSVKHYCYVGSDLYLRYKVYPNITKHIEITNLEVDTNTNELRFINGFTPRHLTENYDIKIAGRWLPFGVEVTEE